jgi:hypothetical protein
MGLGLKHSAHPLAVNVILWCLHNVKGFQYIGLLGYLIEWVVELMHNTGSRSWLHHVLHRQVSQPLSHSVDLHFFASPISSTHYRVPLSLASRCVLLQVNRLGLAAVTLIVLGHCCEHIEQEEEIEEEAEKEAEVRQPRLLVDMASYTAIYKPSHYLISVHCVMPGCGQLQLEEKEREDEIRIKALEERITLLENNLITATAAQEPATAKAETVVTTSQPGGVMEVDASVESAPKPEPNGTARPSVELPWPTADSCYSQARKSEVVAFLQANCTPEFLSTHKLTGSAKAVTKKTSKDALHAAYSEVLSDPSLLKA